MKIFNASQIRAWDAYTITNEPVSSADLMERAALKCVEFISAKFNPDRQVQIFCGRGNNGGDGIVIARMLSDRSYNVSVYTLYDGREPSPDQKLHLAKLQLSPSLNVFEILQDSDLPAIGADSLVIDCLFGSGLHREPSGIYARIINLINAGGAEVIAIDVPSGLPVDGPAGNVIIKATYTLTFQTWKLAFMAAENEEFTGKVVVLDIGLHAGFSENEPSRFQVSDNALAKSIYKPRKEFSHKGSYGHALLVAGSYGKMGAAVLAARACLRTGAGLLTCHIPSSGYDIMQTSLPEAMVSTDYNSSFNTAVEQDTDSYKVVGIGPGIGMASETVALLKDLLTRFHRPMVIDADALNILAKNEPFWTLIPQGSVLTPHPKEFERLFGKTTSSFERFDLALSKASELKIVIVLKGHHTLIALPDGRGIFNSTGNAGLAKGGTGDTLTGMITALLAQGYQSADAAIMGVYLHGLAGEIASSMHSMEAMLATDLIESIGAAFNAYNLKTQ